MTHREASVMHREDLLKRQEACMMRREDNLMRREALLTSREDSLTSRKACVTNREALLMRREASLTRREACVMASKCLFCAFFMLLSTFLHLSGKNLAGFSSGAVRVKSLPVQFIFHRIKSNTSEQ